MQLIRPDIDIDFIGRRKLTFIFFVFIALVGVASLIKNGGPLYGIDFTGGTLVQVSFERETSAAEISGALSNLDLGTPVVQGFGDDSNEFLIRLESTTSELQGISVQITEELEKTYGAGQVDTRRAEMVGPQVGKDLRNQGIKAVLYAMIGILIYVAWRFELRFAVCAVMGLFYVVVFTLGMYSLFAIEIDLPVIAAFLAVVGYSLNDTIVIFDRIRENLGKYNKESFTHILNRSINETLSRTIITSGSTLVVVLALFLLGGGVIHNFAFGLIAGVGIGPFSTIFIACPLLLLWPRKTLKSS